MSTPRAVTPTDRGLVFVRKLDDGAVNVIVCASVSDGEPVSPFAIHKNCTSLDVAPDVTLASAGRNLHSTEVVEVFADTAGVVHVSALRGAGQQILKEEAAR